jgi:hypothetical protein
LERGEERGERREGGEILFGDRFSRGLVMMEEDVAREEREREAKSEQRDRVYHDE